MDQPTAANCRLRPWLSTGGLLFKQQTAGANGQMICWDRVYEAGGGVKTNFENTAPGSPEPRAKSDQVRIFKIRGHEDLSQHFKLNEL